LKPSGGLPAPLPFHSTASADGNELQSIERIVSRAIPS
jgi:hypothetical protein